jgi:predicted AlkP superfamily phosphohydrolase/phosphomutase
MNVPVTFPPQRNVQRMVSGFLSPGLDKAAHPEELRTYLEEIDYKLDVNAKLGHKDDKSEFFENAHATLDARYEAFDNYIGADDWDLFFGVFMTTDRVNHFAFEDYQRTGRNRGAFMEFYQQVDEYVGALWRSLPDDVTTIVASDHGFTTLNYEVNCNQWLAEQGWLSYEDDDHESLSDISADAKAYSFIPGRFYVNLEGREPRGGVPEDQYRETVAELKAMLEDMDGPDGRPVADMVVEKADAFRGDHEDIAPDLVVVPNDGFDLKSGFRGKDRVFDPDGPRNGMHTFHNATLITDDPDVAIDEDVDLLDIAPTILDLMDFDYPRASFDGGSLVGAGN